jgi:transcriptional regulator with XRE-family HTH domain
MTEFKNLARTVKRFRIAKGITRRQLSKKSGLSMDTIRRVEKAAVKAYNPHLDTLAYLAHGLGTDLSDLLYRRKHIASRM